ncbi:xanthine dehydrogenase molybdopterin binding subunit [Porticoccus sp. W117]|uniref:xanthine dehydrogenase molybdopterin binding subunit n=1 Tax=Porticoccus sp. W117 TaxID=3054777 RepID=UPI002596ABBA|nr:xanthine dehydrogenase molybdopterin binding subunit [Porticoccus sp. W117]MDM3872328.1 xanthine dehydrogenase molybdopterin binding subunit [Porticoccus sp. W117]
MRSLPTLSVNEPGKPTGLAGESLKHESAHKHVSGEAQYVDDIPTPASVLHAYAGFSTVARGIVKSMDLSAVAAAPGVVDVLTLHDVPGHKDIGPVFPGDPLFLQQGDEVQFHGQVLFAVAATSYEAARKAARLATVKYQPLEGDITIEQGLENQSFVRPKHVQARGDVAKAVANAEHYASGELHIGGQEHLYLEGQVSLATPTEDGGIFLNTSTQNPTEAQKLVAEVLDIPMSLVVVDTRRMGGGFGGKETSGNHWSCIAALFAQRNKRPVKLRLARSDDMNSTGKRHHFLSRYEVGFDAQGRIQGLDLELSGGCGMSPDLSDAIVDRAMFHSDNAYFLPAAKITGHRVKTNTVSNVAFRGFGGPQGVLAIEEVVERIARLLGKDVLSIRKANFYTAEQGRDTTHYGQKIENHIIPGLVARLEETSDYWNRRKAINAFNASSPYLKKGLALTPVKFGISFTATHLNQAGALIHIYTDGSIHLNHGGTEMGQGLFTKVAQIVASEFQVDVSRIVCSATRTDKVPNTSPTAASSGSDLNGMAARNAAVIIKERLIAFAAKQYDVSQGDVTFDNNQVAIGDRRVDFSEFVQQAYLNRISLSAAGYYSTPKIYYNREESTGRPFFYFANGAAVSEVLIDTLTGEYKVQRVDICHDVGTSLNPAVDIGQIEGAFIQGMGWLTTEELVWGDDGRLQTISPASYKIPAIGDTPPEFNVELLPDSPNVEATIFHSKAVGEPPFMLATSVWCALRDAVSSLSDYRVCPELDAPATPERVLRACEKIILANKGRSASCPG